MSGEGNPDPLKRRRPLPTGEFVMRLASGLVLASAATFLAWAGLWPFVLLVLLCVAGLAWEWVGLKSESGATGKLLGILALVVAASISTAAGHFMPAIAGLIAIAAIAYFFSGLRWSALGLLYVGLPAVAVIHLRSDENFGLWAVLFLLLVVWCSDILAYLCGRAIGGPKLAPSISPGKTWSGAIGGLIFPALLSYGYALWIGGTSTAILAIVGAALAVIAQAGDLVESAIKRSAGVKDSSRLIPGHGGLLDRLDGFIFAAVGAGLLSLLRDVGNPGQALLIWP